MRAASLSWSSLAMSSLVLEGMAATKGGDLRRMGLWDGVEWLFEWRKECLKVTHCLCFLDCCFGGHVRILLLILQTGAHWPCRVDLAIADILRIQERV